MSRLPVPDIGAFLREQRESAQLSLRQAAELAGISNPYLSQIERGLRRPSAQILQRLAKGLQVSAEQMYVQAGLLEPGTSADTAEPGPDRAQQADRDERALREVLARDQHLDAGQRRALLEVYRSFVRPLASPHTPTTTQTPPRSP